LESKYNFIRADPIIIPSALVLLDIASTSFRDFIPKPTSTGVFVCFLREDTFLLISE
jgi:hypothetical protein